MEYFDGDFVLADYTYRHIAAVNIVPLSIKTASCVEMRP